MDEVLFYAITLSLIYLFVGVVYSVGYWLVWGGPPRARHIVVWPVLATSMLTETRVPDWMSPSPRQRFLESEADRRQTSEEETQ